jgi:SAM-dependent methyltransferase
MDKYEETLIRQSQNSQKPSCKTYYSWLYSQISRELKQEEKYLEIGAGAGISRFFLEDYAILRSDFMPWENGQVIGKVDAQDLPYSDNQFSGVFGVDMLHHVEKPAQLLIESLRVTNYGGILVFVEPYVSIISYFVYKIFHPERVTIPTGFNPTKTWVSSSPSDGDQSVAQRIFCSKSGKNFVKAQFGDAISVHIDYLSPTAFYLTRGLNNPSNLPAWLISAFIKIDQKTPRLIRKATSSRMIIVIQKKSKQSY